MSNTVYFAAGQSARVSYILKKEEFFSRVLKSSVVTNCDSGLPRL